MHLLLAFQLTRRGDFLQKRSVQEMLPFHHPILSLFLPQNKWALSSSWILPLQFALTFLGAKKQSVCDCVYVREREREGGRFDKSQHCLQLHKVFLAAHITFVIRETMKTCSQYSQMSSALPWLLHSLSLHLQEHSKEGGCNHTSAVQSLLSTADKAETFKDNF